MNQTLTPGEQITKARGLGNAELARQLCFGLVYFSPHILHKLERSLIQYVYDPITASAYCLVDAYCEN